MKMKEIDPQGGSASLAFPLDPPLHVLASGMAQHIGVLPPGKDLGRESGERTGDLTGIPLPPPGVTDCKRYLAGTIVWEIMDPPLIADASGNCFK